MALIFSCMAATCNQSFPCCDLWLLLGLELGIKPWSFTHTRVRNTTMYNQKRKSPPQDHNLTYLYQILDECVNYASFRFKAFISTYITSLLIGSRRIRRLNEDCNPRWLYIYSIKCKAKDTDLECSQPTIVFSLGFLNNQYFIICIQ